jgi:phosphatidylglycerophosphate synthase
MVRKIKEINEKIKEDTFISKDMINIPSLLNVARIILTFVIIYMIVIGSEIELIVFVFVIAAVTDWFDGFLARKFKLTNDFGRKADMFADRILWIGTTLAIIFVFGIRGMLEPIHGLQILLIMSREVVSAPFAITGAFTGSVFPPARYIAKITTFLQGFALPALMLSVYYTNWIYLSLPLSVIIGITGSLSGLHYIHDIEVLREGKKNVRY